MNTETNEPKSSVNEAKSEAGLAASGLLAEHAKIITDAIERSASPANGGIMTFVLPDGSICTNAVVFRRSQMAFGMSDLEKAHALNEWRRMFS